MAYMMQFDGTYDFRPKTPAWIIAVFFFLQLAGTHATETRDYAIELSASIQRDPPAITLRWRPGVDGLGFTVARRVKQGGSWQELASLSRDATSFTDRNAAVGEAYEYRVLKNPVPSFGGSGFIFAGIEAPLVENRGKIVLIVDATFSAPLEAELNRLEQDLAGDGWQVRRHDVSRQAKPAEVRARIQDEYRADPANVKCVFLFGHIPVPYSGNINPDGHPEHKGAWPADAYYGDMDGNWTDSQVNNNGSARSENKNVPGDGKFDQSTIPSSIELAVGRVDLANMPSFAPKTELDLLRQYLNKDHNFRHGITTLPRRALINDNFGENGGEAFAASGWRSFSAFFGSDNITAIPGWQYFDKLGSEGFLWSYACGGGAYNYCHYVGGTGGYAATDVKTVFTFLLGSYFGDWDAESSFLRGPLGSTTYGLTAAWAGRPHWFAHHMALGETIGFSTRVTQNAEGYHPRQHERGVHVALMGDPTLRMHPVPPPSNVTIYSDAGGRHLSWNPSPDPAVLGYHVYRADTAKGPFIRVNTAPVTGTTYSTPFGEGSYMVKAIKLEESASGSYYNSSQGIPATAAEAPPVTVIPLQITFSKLGPEISFPSKVGKVYALESTRDFKSWELLSTVGASTGATTIFPGQSTPAAFFRVRQL